MRRAAAVLALAIAAAGCRSGASTVAAPSPSPAPSVTTSSAGPTPSPSRPSRTPRPTPSATTSPTPAPLPAGVPSGYRPDDPAGEVPAEALVPAGATVTGSWFPRLPGAPSGTIVVTYASGDDPFAQEHGLVVWRRSATSPHWRPTVGYADRPRSGVLGIRVVLGDATGDGASDVLAFDGTGGTGDCGAWRIVQPVDASLATVFPLGTCDTSVVVATDPAGLTATVAVFRPGDAHCCPSAFRISRLAWDGSAFVVTHRSVSPAPGG